MVFSWHRRYCIALALGCAVAGLKAAPAPTVLVLGDSLSAEYGLRRGSGWVQLLGQRLTQAQWVNASISGDTTSGGRARLPALLQKHKPAVLVLALGGNDALRGLPLQLTRDNLQAMVQLARQSQAKVLLLGMQVPPNYGQAYARDFAALYREVAQGSGASLVPFFLQGVADDPDPLRFFQADRIHPNEAAQSQMARNVEAPLRKLLP